jgi:hypothetical protein
MQVAPNETASLNRYEFEDSVLDLTELRQKYFAQGEFLYLEDFLSEQTLRNWRAELELLKPHLHRNFIPRHKKGGSVGYAGIKAYAPSIDRFYLSDALRECLQQEGDHIGFHYDTSYYKDRRWTALIGLEDRSSSRLLCHLHTKNSSRSVEKLEIQVKPGALVLFNGDTVYHAVTPTKAGEERYIISMQFVTSAEMNPFLRFFSNLKDAFGYFGLKQVFVGKR